MKNFKLEFVMALLVLTLAGCDFHGPWEYYPDGSDVYAGIYTYGYVISGDEPYVCFSKVYELDETSAENFAFYDSAYVTVKGRFLTHRDEEVEALDTLYSSSDKPNCFSGAFRGITGESYTLEAFFEWDSSGHKVSSRFKAQATVPSAVKVKGLSVPQQSGDYEWVPYDENHRTFEIEFLEFPMDMEFVKCALDYDKSVRGVLAVLNYDIDNEESQKTTINSMLEGFTEEDDEGYRGIAIHDPLERSLSLGFTANQKIADYNALDTAYLMNMYLPLGYSSVDLYSTDAAYIDYVNKVRASVSDSRIVPESNIENGMGVFSGMAKTRVLLRVKGDGVDMKHIAWRNCSNTEGDNSDSWDSRGCRLYQDVACSGEKMSYESDMEHLNMNAYSYYRYDGYSFSKTCYASNVKAAMMLDTTKWSVFLPDTIQEDDKLEAYADGLKRYCVASNFENNKLADCYDLYQQCMVSPDGNDCKNYLWLWCADRGWDLYGYEQCRSALVSRYYLGKVKSSVYKREIQSVCRYDWNSMCENWCERRRDGSVVCE